MEGELLMVMTYGTPFFNASTIENTGPNSVYTHFGILDLLCHSSTLDGTHTVSGKLQWLLAV